MNRYWFVILLVLVGMGLVYGQTKGKSTQLLVKVLDEENRKGVDSVTQHFQAEEVRKQSLGKKSKQHIDVILFPAGTDLEAVIKAYQGTGEVEYAEPDFEGESGGLLVVPPNDDQYQRQWGLHNTGILSMTPALPGADIDMENAWEITQGDSNIIVAVIDEGAKMDHPEFAGRIWINKEEIRNNGIDDDQNGYVDDYNGWDFANKDNDATDDQGHGTNVAGIIGANGNNSIGFAGVDWKAKLMILKALDQDGNGLYSWWTEAITYAVDHGARVINLSLGGSSASTSLQNAVKYALDHGVVVVACMMNTNSDVTYYPAAYTGVIAVGSTNPDDSRSSPFPWSATSGSNYGNHISVSAPGNYIYGLDYQSNTNYTSYWAGTSQAAPHVAGVAALLLAQDAKRTPAQIKSILETTAEDLVGKSSEDTQGWDKYHGYGRINAFLALSVYTPTSIRYGNKTQRSNMRFGISEGARLYDLRGRLIGEKH